MWAEVYFVLSQFTLLTDGRTDVQTVCRSHIFLMANTALYSMQCGKNKQGIVLYSRYMHMPIPLISNY